MSNLWHLRHQQLPCLSSYSKVEHLCVGMWLHAANWERFQRKAKRRPSCFTLQALADRFSHSAVSATLPSGVVSCRNETGTSLLGISMLASPLNTRQTLDQIGKEPTGFPFDSQSFEKSWRLGFMPKDPNFQHQRTIVRTGAPSQAEAQVLQARKGR